MDTKQLSKWAEKYDVEKKTIEGFWYYIDSFERKRENRFLTGTLIKVN